MKNLITLAILMLAFVGCNQESSAPKRVSLGGGNPFQNMTIRWGGSALSSPLNLGTSQSFINDFTAQSAFDENGRHPFEQMAKKWDDSFTDIDFLVETNSSDLSDPGYTQLSQYRDSTFGIYKSTSWFPQVSSSALAITQFFGIRRLDSSGQEYLELTHADIIFNYRDWGFSLDPNDISNYDLMTVALHEMGHFLGLPHESDWGTLAVMQPFLSKFESHRTPYSADVNALMDLYQDVSTAPLIMEKSAFSEGNREPEEEIGGYFELRADGECRHYIENHLVHSHKVDLKK